MIKLKNKILINDKDSWINSYKECDVLIKNINIDGKLTYLILGVCRAGFEYPKIMNSFSINQYYLKRFINEQNTEERAYDAYDRIKTINKKKVFSILRSSADYYIDKKLAKEMLEHVNREILKIELTR